MKLNNKGFALTSMIYMLIVLFLMIMLLVLSNLAQRKVVLDKLTYDIKNKLDQGVSINAAELPYQNQTTGIYYETLELAITKATSGDTIKVLKNVTDQSTPSIPQGKEIKIDIAGKEVTLSQMITNDGTLDVYTSEPVGIIYNSNQKTIKNNSTGTLTINGTDATNTLSITNTTTSSASRVFVNEGDLTINNANIEIKNAPSPSSSTDSYIVTNYGSVEVNNSTLTNTVRNSEHDAGIINPSGYPNARIVFNSGTIKTSGTTIYNNSGTSASFDDPVIRITGGTIVSSKAYAIRENITNSYDVISGGELYNENTTGYPTVNMNGKLKMTGGTIYAYNGSSLNVNSTGSADITGGYIVKDKNPITNSWVGGATINTAGTSNLTVAGNAVIESKSGNSSNVIYHASTGTLTIDGNATVENKGAVTATTLKKGKISVNGGKVKSNGGTAIINSMDSSTSSSYGIIEIKGGIVETTGDVAVNTNSAYGIINIGTQGAASNTYPQINGAVRQAINTAGDTTIYSGTITATTKEAVHIKKNGIINGGVITGISSYGILTNDANSKLTVNDGTITTPGSYTITTSNAMGGTIEINGGTITKTGGVNATVNNYLGTTTIKGGTITSTTAIGVYTTSGTITIGTNDSEAPSTSIPSITGKTYGVQATSGTINFYDGKIIGQGGTGSAISGTVTKPTGYNIQKDLSSSTETAYLKGTYVVNIDPNGGTYNGTTSTTGYAANSGSTINVGNPTRSGYTFGGWLPTKQDYGATWVEVFYHNNQQGTVLFSTSNSWSEAKSFDNVDKYSILGQLEKFRTNTSQPFEFLLEYDEITGKYNRWQQTANPVTTSLADGAATTPIGYSTNFTGSHIDWTGCSWGGLTRSSRSSVFLDGAVANNGWWYAIAPATAYNGGIPGPNSTVVKQGMHLWVKANDNLSNINQQVTGVVIKGIYTVKHNITLKAIWIPN